jgi:hypothetical protein
VRPLDQNFTLFRKNPQNPELGFLSQRPRHRTPRLRGLPTQRQPRESLIQQDYHLRADRKGAGPAANYHLAMASISATARPPNARRPARTTPKNGISRAPAQISRRSSPLPHMPVFPLYSRQASKRIPQHTGHRATTFESHLFS